MRRALVAIGVGACGLLVGWVGQGVWRQSPDEIWAACAVVGVLSALAIAFHQSISSLLARITSVG